MSQQKKAAIEQALTQIFQAIDELRTEFDNKRQFTLDGRIVGDIGEILAEIDYDLIIDKVQQADHDAITSDGRRVQIKATFKDKLTFKTTPELYLGLKLYKDAKYDVIYNGSGLHIENAYKHRKGLGRKQLSFSIDQLKALHEEKNTGLNDGVKLRAQTKN